MAAAVHFHFDLDVARAHVETVRAGQTTVGEMPNPTLSFAPSIASNAGATNPWTLGFSFDVPIETAGKREHRVRQAKKLTEAARLELADAVWRVRSHVRDALADYILGEQAAATWAHEVESRDAYARMLDARLKAGETGRAEVDLARIDLLAARQSLRAAEGQVADARARLAAAIGVPVAGLANAQFAWPGIDRFTPPKSDNLQSAGLLNRLDIRRSLAEYAAAEAALQLEIAKQYPDVHLGPGYTFDQGQNKWEFGLSVVIPVLNQNGGAIAEATARRTELAAKFSALQAQVIAETESALARYQSALNELAEVDAQITLLDRDLSAAQHALEAGEQDRLTVTGLQVQRYVAQRLRIDAVRKSQSARAALEDAVQRPVPLEQKDPVP